MELTRRQLLAVSAAAVAGAVLPAVPAEATTYSTTTITYECLDDFTADELDEFDEWLAAQPEKDFRTLGVEMRGYRHA